MAALGLAVRPAVPLAEHTTFRLGGPCRAMIDCRSAAEAIAAAQALAGEPYVLLGGGSNVLVADEGLDAVVLRYETEGLDIERDDVSLLAGGGMALDALVEYAVGQGLEGLTALSGIPGTVGGAIAGNAGAFGEQIGDRVRCVLTVDPTGRVEWETAGRLGFAYRQSAVTEQRKAIVSAWLDLSAGERDRLRKRREEILALRRARHPDWRAQRTAGSFFKNLEPERPGEPRRAAGRFLEQAGCKALREGGAYVFERHANIVMAGEGAKARDVRRLTARMAEAVRARFGIALHPEVRSLGFTEDKP